jgi:hypothetical protein
MQIVTDSILFSGCCQSAETTTHNRESGYCAECGQGTEYGPEVFEDADPVNALIARASAYLALACVAAYAAGFVSGGLI